MRVQTEYESNIDYNETYKRVAKSFPAEQSAKGILTIYLGDATVNISPNGRVQITCNTADEKEEILNLLKPYLAPASGKLSLRPYRVHFHCEWPPPPEFSFSACSESYGYVRAGLLAERVAGLISTFGPLLSGLVLITASELWKRNQACTCL